MIGSGPLATVGLVWRRSSGLGKPGTAAVDCTSRRFGSFAPKLVPPCAHWKRNFGTGASALGNRRSRFQWLKFSRMVNR
jgi:hypothetical protein